MKAAQRIREWQPQTTAGGFSTTQIGFQTTQVSHAFTAGAINRNMTMNSTTQIGFMTTREALSILPPEQLSDRYTSKKRKSEIPSILLTSKPKPAQPKQTSLSNWIKGEPEVQPQVEHEPPLTRVISSGIIQDRGPPPRKNQPPLLPSVLPPSSPERGCDPDLLPAVSFSSPYDDSPRPRCVADTTSYPADDDVPTSPLRSKSDASSTAAGVRTLPWSMAPSERKSLGIRRGMKPWPSKK